MKFSEDAKTQHHIQSYEDHTLRIANNTYTRPIIITNKALCEWSVSLEQIDQIDIAIFEQYQPEIVIIGTGDQNHYPRNLMQALINKNIGVEVMRTTAACRTFNLLLNEGRRVVAGLIV